MIPITKHGHNLIKACGDIFYYYIIAVLFITANRWQHLTVYQRCEESVLHTYKEIFFDLKKEEYSDTC
jgi:hypothetical protein